MAKALQEVLPDTCHGLCTWHLMQNGIKHLGNLMKHGSHFLRDLKACMYGYEEETEFETAWSQLLLDYNIHENTWIKSTYSLKEKWAACYMKKVFTLGMRSTQLSESLNADMKRCLKPDVDILKFFKLFEPVVEDKRYNELECEFEARDKLPRLRNPSSHMLKQLAKIYTPTIFDLFQDQNDLFWDCCVKQRRESESFVEYVINMVDYEGEWKVLFYPHDKTISCTCRKFETWGILCCHALKVFEAYDVKKLPDQYILKRWTKEARTGIIYDAKGNEIEDDPKLGRTLQYNSLCHDLDNIASEVAGKDEEVSFIRMVMHEAMKKVMECRLEKRHETNERDDPIPLSRIDMPQPTGIKKRAGSKRRTRIKSRVELRHRNGKASKSMSQPIITLSQSEQSTDIGASSQMQFENPFSFTKLLMDQSEGPISLGGPELGGDKL
ncbi:protein FAR1-RELATED SEQUENCE 5-like [Senna tora]|uniref:Protein FAR1-RELATED SEQUENCE n=1 Tax=Senna tora TaxID=362788 RepID=A0A834SF88_9FABA|nr:protein FAR1-RELATED SEQUENCE 5-like [Senna tora]